jgi:GntR family transcriptional regulator
MPPVTKHSESTEKAGVSLDFHPLYLQIKELLIQRVLRGDWRPGEILPSEFKLAAEFKVSQGTVRKALDELAAEKMVIRMQGKGTFVAARNTRHTPLHFFRLTIDNDRRWEPHNTKLLSLTREPATGTEATALGLPAAGRVFRIHRVRYFEQTPMIYEVVSLAEDRFPDFESIFRRDERANLYALLEQTYGVLVVKADEKLRACSAGEHEAGALAVSLGTALLSIERVSYGIDGTPIEWRRMVCETSRQHYATTLT